MSQRVPDPPKEGVGPGANVASEVVKTVVGRYYSRGVEAADRVRDRSERAYTIAGAIAAVLVAAGLLTNLDKRSTAVQVLVLSAVTVWLIAVVLFIWVVAVQTSSSDGAGWNDDASFVKFVADRVNAELGKLRKRQFGALLATGLAVLLTIAALVVSTTDSSGASPERARLELTRQADAALTKFCGRPIGAIYAKVNPDDLGKEVVPLHLPAGECGNRARTDRVPKRSIEAEEKVSRYPPFPQ